MKDWENYECDGQIDLVDYLKWLSDQEEEKLNEKTSKPDKEPDGRK